MLRKISLFFLTLGIIFSGVTAYAVWQDRLPLVSPVALIEVITGNNTVNKSKKIIYGFLPYWNLKFADQLNISSLTHFAYFAADLNPDGSINKINSQKEKEPGWNKLNSPVFEKLFYQVKLLGQKTILTVTAMDTDVIDSLLSNPANSSNAITSILEVYKEKGFNDINIDFEYIGEPSPTIREGFVTFINSLKKSCRIANPKCQIDIDIFADTSEKYRLWDIAALNPSTDKFIVMAYDYYRKSSTVAGPVAPLTGRCQPGMVSNSPCVDMDVVTHVSQLTKIIPPEKIILGVPFYGYEWQTASRDFMSNTYPKTGALASFTRIQSLFSDSEISSLSAQWSEITLSPYLVYEKEGKIFQIHFENQESLKQKVKLVKSANLGGIAIWALGYETPYRELWDALKELETP